MSALPLLMNLCGGAVEEGVDDFAAPHEADAERDPYVCFTGPANSWNANFYSYFFGGTAIPTAPTTFYLAAFTVMPANDGTGGTEVTIGQGGYARIAVTNNTTNFPAVTTPTGNNPVVSSLAVSFSFPIATANWSSGANIVGYGLYSAATGGTFLGSAYALTQIVIGDVSTTTGLITFSSVHNRSAGDAVGFFESNGTNASLPTGFNPYNTTQYYVLSTNLTTTAYEVSLTQGGAAVVPTTTGVGAFFAGQSYVQPVLNGQTLTFPANAIQFSLTAR